MTSYSSSSFSGPSSPVSPSPLAQTVRKQLSGPRSPRAYAGYQPSSNTRRENGSKVRSDLGRERCLPDRTGTSAAPRKYPRGAAAVSMSGLFPIQTGRESRSPRMRRKSADDSGSPSSTPPRETPGRAGVISKFSQDSSFQAHQPHHESSSAAEHTNRRLQQGRLQVARSSQPASSLLPPPLPVYRFSSATPPPRRPSHHRRAAPSLAHSLDDRRVHFSSSGSPTPQTSPRPQSVRSTPSRRPPPAALIRRALVPAPGQPTLAMSMQIHAPSPIMSTSPHTNMSASSTRSRSRPSSPLSIATQLPLTRPPMPRPSSRSEKLLRDTLRRAEEYDRMAALAALPSPSLFGAAQPAHGFVSPPPSGRRSRRNTSSSVNTDGSLEAFAYCDSGACDSDEDESPEDPNKAWLWRSPSVSSSSSGHGQQYGYFYQPQGGRSQPPLPHRHSDDHETHRRGSVRSSNCDEESTDQHTYGSPSSPSPARTQLQRSPRSAPSVSRSSVSQSRISNAHSTSRSPAEPERSPCGCQQAAVTPHEAVLRSRLEGVLRGAKQEQERRRSREREYNTGSGSSNSMASSRNLSGEDWSFAAGESTSPLSNRSDLPVMSHSGRVRASTSVTAPTHARSRSYRSPSTSSQALRSPISAGGPLTPPPTPPFNARVAAAQCKAMDGYVSFADIEGLGVPSGEVDDLDDEDAKRSRAGWLKWLPLSHKQQQRERSESVPSSR